MTRDKWLLTGAWVVMAAFAGYSLVRIAHSPKVDPTIEKLCQELEKRTICGGPEKPEMFKPPFQRTNAGLAYVDPEAARFRTKMVGIPIDHKKYDVQVLPKPVTGWTDGTLDGITVRWSIDADRKVALKDWMERKEAKVLGFIVLRQRGNEAAVQVAELGPKETSWKDLSAEPKQTYRYMVSLKGMEHDRETDPPVLRPAVVESERGASAKTPSATRLTLVGGDKSHGMLRVETYDRAKKMWVAGKPMMAAPGEAVASTGWTLKGLRFIDFTLVADMMDDDGVARVLTTRE